VSVVQTETALSVGNLPSAPADAPQSAPPALRLLPAPVSEPPYDDEVAPCARTLRLVPPAWSPGALAPAPLPTPARSVPLRLVPPADDDDLPPRTPLAELPPARPFAHALVQRLLEVLAGLRPVSQLQRDTSFELFEELERVVCSRPRSAGVRPSTRDVRSVHVQTREDGVAEVCATVRRGGRMTALALRLEGVSGAWRCTALTGV
jgi:hypothetical protein